MKNQILKQIKENHRSITRPILSHEIEARYGITGAKVRDIIRKLRREGEPIGGCKNGYYYCITRRELDSLIDDLKGRALSLLKTISELEKNRDKPGYNQMEMF